MDLQTKTVLGFCRDIEKSCADIYLYYAGLFSEDPELRALWAKTAREEINHANLLEMLLRCRGLELNERRYDTFKYRNQARIMRDIQRNIQLTHPSPTDALRAAINLEKRLLEFHLDSIADFKHTHEEAFFRQLMAADRHHVKALEDAYRDRLQAERNG